MDIEAQFQRHALRRAQGIPTITVLLGEPSRARTLAVNYCAKAGLAWIDVPGPRNESFAQRWVKVASLTPRLAESILGRLTSEASGCSLPMLSAMTGLEREVALSRLSPERAFSGMAAVLAATAIIEWGSGQRHALSGADSLWDHLLGRLRGSTPRGAHPEIDAMAALSAVLPESAAPWLIVALRPTIASDLDLALLWEAALTLPRLPIILATTSTEWRALIDRLQPDRLRVLLSETVVRLDDLEASLLRGTRDHDVSSPSSMAADAAITALKRALSGAPTSRSDAQLARSLAERILFERLAGHVETRGEFQLNGALNVDFGNRPAEVDLLARGLRVALEVDGFFHFVDSEAYRRDRRKDVLLQERGFLVLRVLAADVAERIEDVVEQVVSVVRFRRSTPKVGGEE